MSRLTVQVEEADSFSIDAVLDNSRTPAVGTDRRSIGLSEGNLFGIGDRIELTYANTDGSDTFNASYSIPINSLNGTISFTYGIGDNELIEEPFTPLDIESQSRFYEFTYRQPLVSTPTQEFALGLTASRIESESFLLGEEFPLFRGADERGQVDISALRFFQEFSTRSDREAFLLRSQFNLGVGAFEASTEREPDSQFFSWRLQGQYVRSLAPDTLLIFRSELQLADQELLSDEQFRVGGVGSVRGYRQDLLLGDNGLYAGVEGRFPVFRIPEWDVLLQIAPFFEVGKVWNSDGTNPNPSTLASLGLGLILSQDDNFTASLYWGIPLMEVEGQGDTLQEDGIYFSVRGGVRF